MKRADPNLDIPTTVQNGAIGLALWMERNGHALWMLHDVADRKIVEAYGDMLRAAGVTHFAHCVPAPYAGEYNLFANDEKLTPLATRKVDAGQGCAIPLSFPNGPVSFYVGFTPADPAQPIPKPIGPFTPIEVI